MVEEGTVEVEVEESKLEKGEEEEMSRKILFRCPFLRPPEETLAVKKKADIGEFFDMYQNLAEFAP